MTFFAAETWEYVINFALLGGFLIGVTYFGIKASRKRKQEKFEERDS